MSSKVRILDGATMATSTSDISTSDRAFLRDAINESGLGAAIDRIDSIRAMNFNIADPIRSISSYRRPRSREATFPAWKPGSNKGKSGP